MNQSVFVGMSGGVDSSVAAFLLKEQGYDVTGFTMLLCENLLQNHPDDNVKTAKALADEIGISFTSCDCRQDFEKYVVVPFVKDYENCRTPNPCIDCNKHLKFRTDLLPENAMIATGHYAIVSYENGRYCLKKSSSLSKDQSYFLYTLSQEVLSRVLFPLGELDKSEVRRIAEDYGLITARKKDSQDICFIPDGNHADFIRAYTGREYSRGNFVDTDGNVLGEHQGLIRYTIGQRKGLGLALKKPMYVYKLDKNRNEVVLNDNDSLFSDNLIAEDFNWVSMDGSSVKSFRALGRIRYRHKEAPCTVTPIDDTTVSIVFDEPQRAITSGQALVLYDIDTDSYVLGGGKIR